MNNLGRQFASSVFNDRPIGKEKTPTSQREGEKEGEVSSVPSHVLSNTLPLL
jgi:hypothetical protein